MPTETTTNIEILDYNPTFKADFKQLNMAWLANFQVSEAGLRNLDDPEGSILDKGGYIFFAQADGKIVATCALLRESYKSYEIADMAVTPQYQGQHIGKQLLSHAIDVAKQAGAKQVSLVTSNKLVKSVELYRAFGFREVAMDPEMSVYGGSDVKMVLNLK